MAIVNELEKLLFFRIEKESVIYKLAELFDKANALIKQEDESVLNASASLQLSKMLELAYERALSGNLWHISLTWALLMSENPFTLSRECKPVVKDSASKVIRVEFSVYRTLFGLDFKKNFPWLGETEKEMLLNYDAGVSSKLGDIVSNLAKELANASTDDEFHDILAHHYSIYGVGILGMNRAFKLAEDGERDFELAPILGTDPVKLSDLVGYQYQKNALTKNTEAFLEGRPANNCLLYGDSGSGKSTSIKALLNEYFDSGLRLIEIYKYQFKHLPELISRLKRRNLKFIIYIDDLSFEEFETEYKFLKSVIEGGIEARPSNILVYATSNRRHLIKENWSDRDDMEHKGDVHRSDTLEEKMSLANRFGLSINFSSPTPMEYHEIVKVLAERAGITMEEKELFRKADAWEIRHGGYSGRAAQQFIIDILSN